MREPFSRVCLWWLVCCCSATHAEQVLVADEKITDLRVAPWGAEAFAIKTTDGNRSSLCAGQWIVFQRDNFTGSDGQVMYERSFSLALAAMTADQRVFVTAPGDCQTARAIGYLE